ncbi:MAG: T9SS type A sorting domain-containing protein [Flavobacteriales bacterium]
MKFAYIYASSLVLLILSSLAHSQEFDWAIRMAGRSSDIGNSILVDSDQNTIVAGSFYYSPILAILPTEIQFHSNGVSDAFIFKLDSNQHSVWHRQFGGIGMDRIRMIKFDSHDNIIAIGIFNDSVDFNPGGVANVLEADTTNAFIMKLTSSGNLLWVRSFSGNESELSSISVDPEDNIIVSGGYTGSVDFDPGIGVELRSTTASQEAFVAKLDSSGTLVWIRTFESNGYSYARTISTSDSGDVWIGGNFSGTIDFDPTSQVVAETATSTHAYIANLSSTGNYVQYAQFPSTNHANIMSIDHYQNGELAAVGYFSGSLEIEMSSGAWDTISTSSTTFFLFRANANGKVIWQTSDESGLHNDPFYLTLDEYDNCLVSGRANYNIWLSKWSPDGDSIFSFTLESESDSRAKSVFTRNDDIYLTGYYQGLADFDPGVNDYLLPWQGGAQDLFVLKLNRCDLKALIESTDTSLTALPSGVTYQWLNCSNNSQIQEETSQTFTPNETGLYKAIVSNGPCIDTTDCIEFTATTGVNSADIISWALFPNPANDHVTIISDGQGLLEIIDQTGATIKSQRLERMGLIDLTEIPSGIFIVKLASDEHVLVKRLVVQ